MKEQSQSVLLYTDLGIAEELKDKAFRDQFFRTERDLDVPAQLKALRKLRKLTQTKLADRAGMKQSAVCRIERAREVKSELETLVKLAEALDARLSVVIEPYEAVVARYQNEPAISGPRAATADTKAGDRTLDPMPKPDEHQTLEQVPPPRGLGSEKGRGTRWS